MTEHDTMAQCLTRFKTLAVVGLSPKPHRESYGVSQVMQRAGYKIVPINPSAAGTEILGEKVYASLQEAAQAHSIELVNVFRNSDDVPPVVTDAIAVGAKAVWLQLGIVNDVALQRARDAGMLTVQNRCIKVEWARLPK
jgi:predicted CoA-binding protein